MKNDTSFSRTTLWRMKKGLSPGLGSSYHKKRMYPGEIKDIANLVRIANVVFIRNFLQWQEHYDDLIQEAILRNIEVAGKSQNTNFLFYVCRNAMRDYIVRWTKGGEKQWRYTGKKETSYTYRKDSSGGTI